MKIILRETIDTLGLMGEVVTVKDGYARNFLIPQEIAYPANKKYMGLITSELDKKHKKLEQEKEEASLLAKKMENVSITIEAVVGEEDKMFGSVTSANISTKLHELGYTIDKRKIVLHEPIKALGIFHVPIKLHTEVHIEVKVWVVKDKSEEELAEEETAT